MGHGQEQLNELRQQIDQIDEQLVDLLNRRAEVVVEVGKVKQADGTLPFYAPDREKRVIEKICSANKGPLPNRVLVAIWRELMSGSLLLEKPLRVGFLGPEGSYSHLAATTKFGASVEYVPFADIRSVFMEVSRRHCDLGVVPVENSVGGTVIDTLDAFVDLQVRVCAETIMPIHHNLLATCTQDKITKIYSKPEVFAQCRVWLSTQMKSVETIAVASTSRAAEMAAAEPGSAAIGSRLAAELYGLMIVCEDIEDNPNNCTRFMVLSNQAAKRTGQDKTALMFATADRAGALADVLDIFRANNVNLTSITSRPSRKQSWEYYFFADAEGHESDENVKAALAAIRPHCLQLTVLGSFPRAIILDE